MAEQSFGNQRQKTALNDYRFPHPSSREPLPNSRYPAQWNWDLTNKGKIVFKINDGVYNKDDQKAYRNKQVEMSPWDRNALFELMLEAATNKDFIRAQHAVKQKQFISGGGGAGRMSENPIVQATFTVLRDENGVISVGYTRSDYKVLVQFDRPAQSDILETVNGEVRPAIRLMSAIAVRGYIEWIRPYLNDLEKDNYVAPEPKNGGNGGGGNGGGQRGGGGNWNNNRGGNGGGGSSSGDNDFDSTIDF